MTECDRYERGVGQLDMVRTDDTAALGDVLAADDAVAEVNMERKGYERHDKPLKPAVILEFHLFSSVFSRMMRRTDAMLSSRVSALVSSSTASSACRSGAMARFMS